MQWKWKSKKWDSKWGSPFHPELIFVLFLLNWAQKSLDEVTKWTISEHSQINNIAKLGTHFLFTCSVSYSKLKIFVEMLIILLRFVTGWRNQTVQNFLKPQSIIKTTGPQEQKSTMLVPSGRLLLLLMSVMGTEQAFRLETWSASQR